MDSLIEAETAVALPAGFTSGSKLARTPPSRAEMTRKVVSVTEEDTMVTTGPAAATGGGLKGAGSYSGSSACTTNITTNSSVTANGSHNVHSKQDDNLENGLLFHANGHYENNLAANQDAAPAALENLHDFDTTNGQLGMEIERPTTPGKLVATTYTNDLEGM